MNSKILVANHIEKAFYIPKRVPILNNICLEVSSGDTIAITGRSGQGKSTLLQILGTLEPPCAGFLTINGQTVNTFNKSALRRDHLAFIFQSFHLLDDYTAFENVLMPAKIARENTSKGSFSYNKALELLEKVGLGDRIHFHSKLLSGGEKQRVALARAICSNPSLILADEPSGNLDKQTSLAIHTLLMEFVQQAKKALIVVTHDPELAAMCKTRYVLQDGILHSQ